MAYITPTEIRNAGGWSSIEAPDAALVQIGTSADAWIDTLLGTTLTAYTATSATKGALAKSAEIYLAAYLFALTPPKDDFTLGPAQSRSNAEAKIKAAQRLLEAARAQLAILNIAFENWSFSYAGGDDYHPTGEDDTNIDIQTAMEDGEDHPFNTLGVSLDD
jgi:hypothetical protein